MLPCCTLPLLLGLILVVVGHASDPSLTPNADGFAKPAAKSTAPTVRRSEELRWELVPQTPRMEPIFGQSCTMFTNQKSGGENEILMYAGFKNNTRNTNDMQSFSVKSHSWSNMDQHSTSSIPWARNAAAIALYTDRFTSEQRLLMFGGSQMDAEALGDTWIFNVDSRVWTEHTAGVGEGPSRRYGSSLILRNDLSSPTAVLFGGAFWQQKFYHNDLWSFSFATLTWTELNSTGDSPSPRFGHCAAYYNKHMYLYGGGNEAYSSFQIVWVYNFDSQRWAQVLQIPPAGRSWAQSVVYNGHWYVVGGDRNGTDFIDVLRWPLDPVSARGPWEVLDITGPLPVGRLDHCVVLDEKILYMIGGYSYEHSGAEDDMWMLDLTDSGTP